MKRRRKSRLGLESLEARLVLSTFTRVADADGFAADFDIDGNYEFLDATSTRLETSYFIGASDHYESRSILEFDISGLSANAVVTSAWLSGNIYALMGASGEPGVDVSVHGQWGDGLIETIDAIRPSLPVGALINQTQAGPFAVELDPQWVQDQLGLANYVGLSLRLQRGVHFYVDSAEGSLGSSTPPPTLTIEFESGSGNTPPDANNDSYAIEEDGALVVDGLGVLANDFDAESDPFQAELITGPAHGTLDLSSNGSFVYTPDPNYSGPDSFTYRAVDSGGLGSEAEVSLTVWPMDDHILLVAPGPQEIVEDGSLTFSAANGNAITVLDLESPRVLVALLTHDGILTLPSTAGLEFPYPDSVNNSSAITFIADDPAEANAALEGLVFTPNADYQGLVSLNVLVRDETYVSFPLEEYATVPIWVAPVNDAPVAVADSYEGFEGQSVTVYGVGVLGNDSDPDGEPLSAMLVSGPAHGALTLNPGGSFTYIPDPNFFGSDSFTYRATDAAGVSAEATVTLTVWGIDDPIQVTAPDMQTINEDTSLTFSAANGNAITVFDLESPPVRVELLVQNGILTLPSTEGLEFPFPDSINNSPSIIFYADNPAEANAALEGLVFTPNADYHGSVYFSILVRDESFVLFPMDAFTYTPIVVTPVDDVPVAVDDFYAAEAGAPFIATLGGGGHGLGVLMNDHDADEGPLVAVLETGPAHGSLAFEPDGTFVYTPEATFNGTDTFTYRAFDGELYSELATATFTVTDVNYAPAAGNDSYSVNEDGALTVAASGVLGNDSDPDSDPLTAVLVGGPAHGALALNADGSFTYTPAANYAGSDSFTYQANDDQLNSNTATVALTVNPVNDAPVANNDSYTVNEDQTLTIAPTPGVTSLTMVSQPGEYIGQGQTYSFTPQNGTFMANRNFDNGVSVHFSGGGQWWDLDFAAPFDAYLTPGHYANATRWPFQASTAPGLDVTGNGRGSNTLTGNFTVTQALYAANGDILRFAATFEQHSEGLAPALTGEIKYNQGTSPSGILLNDSDVEGDMLTAIIVSGPAHGTLSLNSDGSFTYRASPNYNGPDSFTYKTNDGVSDSNVATVNLTVNPVNDFPTATPDTYFVDEDATLSVAAPGVLANDSDIDSPTLTATLVTSPTHGALTFNSNGSFVYTPHANYNGNDSFQYAARDGQSFSFIVTVTLVVGPVNDAPVANNDSYTTSEDTPLTVAAPGVRGNDTDVEGSTLTAILVTGPAHGALTLNADGSFTYTPAANYAGADSFTYNVSDGAAQSNLATVALTVTGVNDAPIAADDSFTLLENSALTIGAPGLLGNDEDVDGDTLAAALISGPVHGFLSLNTDGSFFYSPDPNYHGADSFTYKVNDGAADSNVATVSLTITNVNEAPIAFNDAFTLAEDSSLTITAPGVLANDGDGDGDALTAVLVDGPYYGTLALNADGSFTYTPDPDFDGVDGFTYKANDGSADSNVATVVFTVTNVNEAPTATWDIFYLEEDGALTIAAPGVLANDEDADGDPLFAELVSGPEHGALVLNSDGSFTYTPDANHHGGDFFTYKASDGSDDSEVTSVTLTITAVNDAPVANAGPDAAAIEGSTVEFDAFESFDIDGDALTYSWDFGDGAFASGPDVSHAYEDNGTYLVKLTVSDGFDSATDTLEMTVINLDPLATIDGPASGVRGQTRTFNFAAFDPSPVDHAAQFSYFIQWGDGNDQVVDGSNSVQVDHVFAATGVYEVRVTAIDKDGGVSSLAEHIIAINAVEMQQGDLVVGGTVANDNIVLKVADTQGGIRVTIGGANLGTFTPARVFVFAQAGGDSVQFSTTKFTGTTYYIQAPAVVQGGDGNDSLDVRGSSAANVLVGGAGADTLNGGLGRDILLGGAGVDTLRGGLGEDVLIGNSTIHDDHLDALLALLAEWSRTDADYATRAAHLQGASGGLNGDTLLGPATILDDAAIDQLFGEGNLDLFFVTNVGVNKDKVNDLAQGELKISV